MLDRLKNHYMLDLLCDPDAQKFYARLSFQKAGGMCVRNYENPAGATEPVLVGHRQR